MEYNTSFKSICQKARDLGKRKEKNVDAIYEEMIDFSTPRSISYTVLAIWEFLPDLRSRLKTDTEIITRNCEKILQNFDDYEDQTIIVTLKILCNEPFRSRVKFDLNCFNKITRDRSVEVGFVAGITFSKILNVETVLKLMKSSDSMASLSLSFGLLNTDCLFDSDQETDVALDVFRVILDGCRDPGGKYGYQSFHCLKLFLTRLIESGASSIFKKIHSEASEVAYLHWDSPIKGISEVSTQIFAKILDAVQKFDSEINYSMILDTHLNRIMGEKTWKAKSKYPPLTVLLPRIGASKILENHGTSFANGLVESLSSMHLCHAGLRIYDLILQSVNPEIWKNYFFYPILNLFRGDNEDGSEEESLSQVNLKNLWLPATVKRLPKTHCVELSDELKRIGTTASTIARMTVLKCINDEVDIFELCQWSKHRCPDLRIAAFSILCQHKRRMIDQIELKLVYDFLKENVIVDSASFRQRLCSDFTVLILRIRDFLISNFRKTDVSAYIRWVDRLQTLFFSNLYPGANYQRLITNLQLIKVLASAFYIKYEVGRGINKSSGSSSTTELLSFAQSNYDLLHFYVERHLSILLRCTLYYMEDVRSEATELIRHFPMEKSSIIFKEVREKAEELTKSPKYAECESAAGLYSVLLRWDDGEDENLHERLLSEYESLLNSEMSFARIAKESPMHGLLTCLRLCCLGRQNISSSFLKRLIEILEQSSLFMLRILSNGSEYNPSFAEMGEAIEVIINDNESSAVETSYDHQLILACSWLNLKECALISAYLVKYCRLDLHEERDFTLNPESVIQCGRIIKTILCRCRHKGVMEACNAAVMDFAYRLLEQRSSTWKEIPRRILEDGLSDLTSITTSVTRRSAGFPFLIQGILSGEARVRQSRELLEYCVERLLKGRCRDQGHRVETEDDVRSHELHVLKSLVHDSALAQSISPFLDRVLTVCMDEFTDGSWAVRNAALQLFGAVIPRILGQKRVRDEDSEHNTVSVSRFFAKYPSLHDSLLPRRDLETPILIPILTMLSRLSYHDNEEDKGSEQSQWNEVTQRFKTLFKCHFSHPVINVRILAVRCYASLTHPKDRIRELEIVHDMAIRNSKSANYLHSCCLLFKELRSRVGDQVSDLVTSRFVRTFKRHPCFVIKDILVSMKDDGDDDSRDHDSSFEHHPGYYSWKGLDILGSDSVEGGRIVESLGKEVHNSYDDAIIYLRKLHRQPVHQIHMNVLHFLKTYPTRVMNGSLFRTCADLIYKTKEHLDYEICLELLRAMFECIRHGSIGVGGITGSLTARASCFSCVLPAFLFDEWSKNLSRYSGPGNSETSRLDCAKALTEFANIYDDNYEILPISTVIRIFDSAWSLSSDEDETIRKQFSEFASKLLSESLSPYRARREFAIFIAIRFPAQYMEFRPFKDAFISPEYGQRRLKNFQIEENVRHYLFESGDGVNVYQDEIDDLTTIRETVLSFSSPLRLVNDALLEQVDELIGLCKGLSSSPFAWTESRYKTLVIYLTLLDIYRRNFDDERINEQYRTLSFYL